MAAMAVVLLLIANGVEVGAVVGNSVRGVVAVAVKS